MKIPTFVLASASPARRRLLETVGIKPVILPSNFDESQVRLAEPAELVETLAKGKAETVATAIISDRISDLSNQKDSQMSENLRGSLVLGCDSLLVVGGEIYGKPADAEEAIARWQKMRGQVGQLYTGHALMDLRQDKSLRRVGVTQVYFAEVTDAEIEAYVATGEPLKCAGCFAIEGKGGLFIEKLEGCHTNVIGLSLPLLRGMLGELGYSVGDFWQQSDKIHKEKEVKKRQISLAKNIDFIPDIVVKDKDDEPIMFVTVRTSPVYGAEEFTLHGLENYQHVPFLMYVNQQYIRIYKAGNFEPVKKLNPLEIFKFYDPKFDKTKMVEFFVITLIESWLRDLDYHWKYTNPPAMKEIEEIGLLAKLDDMISEDLAW